VEVDEKSGAFYGVTTSCFDKQMRACAGPSNGARAGKLSGVREGPFLVGIHRTITKGFFLGGKRGIADINADNSNRCRLTKGRFSPDFKKQIGR